MQTYCYECDDCGHKFEIISTYEDRKNHEVCPSCKSTNVFRDFQSEGVLYKSKEPRTLGALADQNTEKFSERKKREIYLKNNDYKLGGWQGPTPILNPDIKSIDNNVRKK